MGTGLQTSRKAARACVDVMCVECRTGRFPDCCMNRPQITVSGSTENQEPGTDTKRWNIYGAYSSDES